MLEGDWPVRAADTVERVVDTVRSKTTGPAIVASRAVVYGSSGRCWGSSRCAAHRRPSSGYSTSACPAASGCPTDPGRAVLGLVGALLWRKRRQRHLVSSGKRCRERSDGRLDVHDVVIIGSGPAGLTAAIYTARANLAPARARGRAVVDPRPARRPADAHHRGRELPRLPRGDHGPGADEPHPGAGRPLRRRDPDREGRPGSTSPSRPFGIWVGDPDAAEPTYRAQAVIVSTGAQSLMLGLPGEQRADRPRRVDLRHLRRLLLPRPGHRRRRRRRLGPRGGDLPHQVRPTRSRSSTAATSCGPRRSCRTGPSPTPRSASSGTSVVEGIERRRQRRGRSLLRDVDTGERSTTLAGHRPLRRHRPPTQHRPVQGPARHGGHGYLVTEPGSHPHQRRRACSPAATSRTTPTARPSPPPAPAAWPPSTPSVGSRPRSTATGSDAGLTEHQQPAGNGRR